MKILLNKTGRDFAISKEAEEALEDELNWREQDFADFFGIYNDDCIEARSIPEMIAIFERLGGKAFPKSSKKGHYEIIAVDLTEKNLLEAVSSIEKKYLFCR